MINETIYDMRIVEPAVVQQ